ncbi:MAG TPA: ABC transporter ATP-binding protein [Gemmatimonadales bacterium]|nr:ABC transporter ATP-binding protein [Gemmatimonadales bacterium]
MTFTAIGASVRYPGSSDLALDSVSVQVTPGSLMAVVGPNGGGKSTLFRALLGLVQAQAGEVLLDGRSIRTWRRDELARVVAAVPQREEPMPMLRVFDAVLFGRYARLGALSPVTATDRRAVQAALERCDAWAFRDRPVDTLSGGEWQRVRLARALAQEPRFLLLDEPTAALDVRHEMELLERVRWLVAEGLGGMVITHHLNLAARYADRMLLLHRGRVAAEGTPVEVLQQDRLAAVFEWPVAVTTWCDGAPQVVPLRPGEHGFPDTPHMNPSPSKDSN